MPLGQQTEQSTNRRRRAALAVHAARRPLTPPCHCRGTLDKLRAIALDASNGSSRSSSAFSPVVGSGGSRNCWCGYDPSSPFLLYSSPPLFFFLLFLHSSSPSVFPFSCLRFFCLFFFFLDPYLFLFESGVSIGGSVRATKMFLCFVWPVGDAFPILHRSATGNLLVPISLPVLADVQITACSASTGRHTQINWNERERCTGWQSDRQSLMSNTSERHRDCCRPTRRVFLHFLFHCRNISSSFVRIVHEYM